MPTNIVVPRLGKSISEGIITRWLKKEGDAVQRDDALFEIAADKCDTEIPSPVSGIVRKILVPAGSKVSVNTVIAIVDEANYSVSTPEAVPKPVVCGNPRKNSAAPPDSGPLPWRLDEGLLLEDSGVLLRWGTPFDALRDLGHPQVRENASGVGLQWYDRRILGGLEVDIFTHCSSTHDNPRLHLFGLPELNWVHVDLLQSDGWPSTALQHLRRLHDRLRRQLGSAKFAATPDWYSIGRMPSMTWERPPTRLTLGPTYHWHSIDFSIDHSPPGWGCIESQDTASTAYHWSWYPLTEPPGWKEEPVEKGVQKWDYTRWGEMTHESIRSLHQPAQNSRIEPLILGIPNDFPYRYEALRLHSPACRYYVLIGKCYISQGASSWILKAGEFTDLPPGIVSLHVLDWAPVELITVSDRGALDPNRDENVEMSPAFFCSSVRRWDPPRWGELTQAAIHAFHQPEERFTIRLHRPHGETSMANKTGMRCYMLSGTCTFKKGSSTWTLKAGEFVDFLPGLLLVVSQQQHRIRATLITVSDQSMKDITRDEDGAPSP